MRIAWWTPVVAGLIGTSLALVPGAPAHATGAIETHQDVEGDVRLYVDSSVGDAPYMNHPRPGRRESDVDWIRTNAAGKDSIRLRVHFRELRRSGDVKRFRFAVQSSTGSVVSGSVSAYRASYGIYYGTPGVPNWAGKASASVHPAVTWRIDYDTNDFVLVVPREVLNHGDWVRSAFAIDVSVDDELSYEDDARAGYRDRLSPTFGTYGPRVRAR